MSLGFMAPGAVQSIIQNGNAPVSTGVITSTMPMSSATGKPAAAPVPTGSTSNYTPGPMQSDNYLMNMEGGFRKFADGGALPMSMAEPWFERHQTPIKAYNPGGLYNTEGLGRTDNIANIVPTGAYIVPADVVSGLGEGNTLAGSAVLTKMFHSQPFGMEGNKLTHGRGVSMPVGKPPAGTEFAKGGETKHKGTHTPIIAAGGEFVIRPDAIIKKFGSLERGHRILDEWIVSTRKKTAKTMMSLPGPK